jgi:hypothetical protein
VTPEEQARVRIDAAYLRASLEQIEDILADLQERVSSD